MVECLINGDFRLTEHAVHIDASRTAQSIRNRFPALTDASIGIPLTGAPPFMVSTQGSDSHSFHTASIIDTVPNLVPNKQAGSDTATAGMQRIFKTGSTLVKKYNAVSTSYTAANGGTTSVNGRTRLINLMNGASANASSLTSKQILANGEVDGTTTNSALTHNTVYFVYHPTTNADSTQLSWPGGTGTGHRHTLFTTSNETDHIGFLSNGTAFRTRVNAQAEVDCVINSTIDDAGISGLPVQNKIHSEKWDINYYLSGAGHNGDASFVKEPIIWCIDYITDMSDAITPEYRTFDSGHLSDHKTWWTPMSPTYSADGICFYHEAWGSDVSDTKGLWIYNQYGVLVGHTPEQANGIGKLPLDYQEIGGLSGTPAKSLHGAICEVIVTSTVQSQAQKLQTLHHLRRKWCIADSYANGKPFHT